MDYILKLTKPRVIDSQNCQVKTKKLDHPADAFSEPLINLQCWTADQLAVKYSVFEDHVLHG